MALGMTVGILAMLLLYALSMLGYLKLRKRFAGAKYAVEIVSVAVPIVFSIAVKAAILALDTPDTLDGGFAALIHAIYSGIGGLAFEGLAALDEISSTVLQCLYTGSSLYAALMFVSVVTTKASYEVYSGLLLFALRFRLKVNTDVYLFTSATEDSMLLAKSICRHYRAQSKEVRERTSGARKEEKVRKCVVIFSGEELGAFDRKNPLHREIMANGYIYWSYAKDSYGGKSVIKRLGLYIDNDYADGRKARAPHSHVRIFAFGNNEELSGLESSNSDIVFDEIKAITRETEKKLRKKRKKEKAARKEKTNGTIARTSEAAHNATNGANKESRKRTYGIPIIDFYVLTDNDINYQLYQDAVRNAVSSVLQEGEKVDGAAQLIDEVAQHFQLHIINEADIVGKSLAHERVKCFQGDKNCNELFISENRPNGDNAYRVMVLGFGKNGQHALDNLYTDTAYVSEEGVPSRFTADVYDYDMSEKAGLFAATHPLYVCTDERTDAKGEDKAARYKKVEKMYERALASETDGLTVQRAKNVKAFEDVKKFMQFPRVKFHKASCFDLSFLDVLDERMGAETGRKERESSKFTYNAFIIALGDDELNIAMANALIDDIKHEAGLTDRTRIFPQSIYVNIRDEKNYNRLNWTERDKKHNAFLKVIRFGLRTDMYSYAQIVDDTEDMRYHYAYSLVAGYAPQKIADADMEHASGVHGKLTEKANELKNVIGGDGDFLPCVQSIAEQIRLLEPQIIKCDWLSVKMIDKESNAYANRFAPYFAARLKDKSELSAKDFINLARLEHERWNRFYMSQGWTFVFLDNEKDKARKPYKRTIKEHNCLCPFDMLKPDVQVNDLVNVALAAPPLVKD